MSNYLVICAAAFFAGVLNTLAGGGTFLTFPALTFIGVPPVIANATSAVAVFPGYLAGAIGFRHEMRSLDRRQLLRLAAITLLGGFIGSALLLVSSDKAFSVVVPFLLGLATAVFAFRSNIQRFAKRHSKGVTPYGFLGMLAVSIYGGYFNGGLGIVLIALFSLWGMTDINQINGLKNALSFVLSAISVATFAAAGYVAWPQAVAMMAASTVGGYLGAPIARALPDRVVRGFIIFIGVSMSVIFAIRAF